MRFPKALSFLANICLTVSFPLLAIWSKARTNVTSLKETAISTLSSEKRFSETFAFMYFKYSSACSLTALMIFDVALGGRDLTLS